MFPLLVAFDLDGTLWERRHGKLQLYPGIQKVLRNSVSEGMTIAICSNHNDPDAAKKFFKETRIEIQGRRRTLMSLVEPGCFIVRPGDKRKHFKEIKRQTLMDYKDMIFFDDDSKHRNVKRKGVTFVKVGDEGLDSSTFQRGLYKHHSNYDNSSSSSEDEGSSSSEESGSSSSDDD
ncbi:acid phosphatase-domain-containing protein [Mycena metata]|uniref:Acid phosphatase-domain-containing protein n=1 Tax=Mycena metata TaxID=1033252 RepID=A0AAD7I6H2_9AGAR|nr:acid phosphatase-domain-containing protein [Mycena metata]